MDKQAELQNANQILLPELAEYQQEVEVLRSELDLLTAILNTVSALVVVFDPQGHIVRCNRACEQTIGNRGDEVINQPFWDLFLLQDDKESLKAVFEKIQVDKRAKALLNEVIAHAHDWITKDGSSFCIAWDYTPCLDSDGALKYVIGIGNDITAKTQAEHAIQEQVAQLEAQNRLLLARDRILEATASAANALLTIENFDSAVNTALQIIGESLDTDRVAVIENFDVPSERLPYWRILYEWDSPHTASQILHPDATQGSWEDIEEWYKQLSQGQGVSCLLDEVPELLRIDLAKVGVKATHIVPIFVEGKFWGVVGFDDCREAKRRSLAELAVLKTTAACIGSAIARDRTQQVMLRAEQARSAELQQALDRLAESEKRYRTLFELSNEGIYRWEYASPMPVSLSIEEQVEYSYQSARITEVNDKFVQQYGLKETDDLVGKRVVDFYVDDLETNRASIRNLFENDYQIRNTETEEIGADGQPRYFLSSVVSDVREGYVWGGWGVQTDITELRQTQQALLQAEQARSAELAKANEALKRSLDSLASEPSLDKFLGQVLTAIAEQFNSPLAEYWYHPEDTAYIGMMSWHGQIYDREEICKRYPTHPGVVGYRVPPEQIHGEPLQHRKQYFITEDWFTNPFTKNYKWMPENGLYKEINVPMVLGDSCIGALVVRLPRGYQITTQQIDLAQALAHQATLAAQLTRLAEEAQQEAQHSAVLSERNRIACELHDTLAQTLAGIAFRQEAAKRLLNAKCDSTAQQEKAQQHITFTLDLAREGIAEVRRSVWALRPGALEHADLCGAFRELLGRIAADTNLQTRCQIQGTPFTLSPEVEGNLLRIGQEAINNALKHAGANKLDVLIAFAPESVQLVIQDDGQGFESSQHASGFGQISMRERASSIGAHLSVTSAPGQGTVVSVTVPMSRPRTQLTTTELPEDNEQKTRILIADDHPVVRSGVAALLQQEPDMTVVAQASDGQQALQLFRQHQPDVGLIDLRMPQMNGVETISAIRAEFPDARLIVLTTYGSDEDIYQGLRAGAKGYLLKDVPREQLLGCIRSVHTGQSYIPSEVGVKLAERMNAPVLSEREREVLCLMAVGKSNPEIGAALGIAQGTVKFHINKMLRKLQVNDRTSAVLVALKRGLANL